MRSIIRSASATSSPPAGERSTDASASRPLSRMTERDDERSDRVRPDMKGVLRIQRQRDALARNEVDPPDGQRLQRPELENAWSAQLVDVVVEAAIHELAERL